MEQGRRVHLDVHSWGAQHDAAFRVEQRYIPGLSAPGGQRGEVAYPQRASHLPVDVGDQDIAGDVAATLGSEVAHAAHDEGEEDEERPQQRLGEPAHQKASPMVR